MKRTIRAALARRLADARLIEDKHLAAFAAEVEKARAIYRRWPDLVMSCEMRPDLQAVLHLSQARGIQAEDVMNDPAWRERVREESKEANLRPRSGRRAFTRKSEFRSGRAKTRERNRELAVSGGCIPGSAGQASQFRLYESSPNVSLLAATLNPRCR